MNPLEWRAYYTTIVQRTMRPEKRKEMVANCGGLLDKETQEQAEERLIAEIKELKPMSSAELVKLEARVDSLEEKIITKEANDGVR